MGINKVDCDWTTVVLYKEFEVVSSQTANVPPWLPQFIEPPTKPSSKPLYNCLYFVVC